METDWGFQGKREGVMDGRSNGFAWVSAPRLVTTSSPVILPRQVGLAPSSCKVDNLGSAEAESSVRSERKPDVWGKVWVANPTRSTIW